MSSTYDAEEELIRRIFSDGQERGEVNDVRVEATGNDAVAEAVEKMRGLHRGESVVVHDHWRLGLEIGNVLRASAPQEWQVIDPCSPRGGYGGKDVFVVFFRGSLELVVRQEWFADVVLPLASMVGTRLHFVSV